MRFVIVLSLVSLSISPLLAAERKVSSQEMARIEAIREMIETRGYSWQAGPTSVSNLSSDEFRQLLGVRVPPDYEQRRQIAKRKHRLIEALPDMAFPQRFDWRDQGGVTSVKNQGSCGSCWAFSAAAAFESQILIHSGRNEDISEQAVISCNSQGHGCDGGWMSTAYDLWTDYGAVRETCMPYHEVDADLCIEDSCQVVARLDGYYYVGENVDDIKQALLNGPVAAAMAVCGSFSAYTGGCYEDSCTEINHGITIVGWDDTMCGGGAWIIKNSWGPDWGENGYAYVKYGTCMIGYGAEALSYNPDQTVYLFHDSHIIDDSSGDGDGNIEMGEVITMPLSLLNIGAQTATNVEAVLRALTPGIDVIDSVASFPDIPKGEARQSQSPHFAFVIGASGKTCGAIEFEVDASCDQGTSVIRLSLQAGELDTLFADDFENSSGWTVGAPDDEAITGVWEIGDPEGTWWGDQPVQPEDDHSPDGTKCFVTGKLAGSSRGTYDVDGGKTTLTSPTIDLSGTTSALLTYYRWYSSNTGSNPNDDDLIVDVSSDNGLTWHNLETLTYDDRRWEKRQFYLEDFITLTDQVKLRFIAQDNGAGGSIVEAAIDDISIVACSGTQPDTVSPTVKVISPNGGEVIECGASYDILWSANDNRGVASVTILLSIDGGISFSDTIAAGEENDGSYTWLVPGITSDMARMKVIASDAQGNRGSDSSDADFSLSGGLATITRDYLPSDIVLQVMGSNPTNRASLILFGIPQSCKVSLDLFDVTGRFIECIASGEHERGYHQLSWLKANHALSPGIYFIRLSTPQATRTVKVVVAK